MSLLSTSQQSATQSFTYLFFTWTSGLLLRDYDFVSNSVSNDSNFRIIVFFDTYIQNDVFAPVNLV